MRRQEMYCEYCDSDFIIETPNLDVLSFCPSCGTEIEIEADEEDDEWDEDQWM